MTIRIFQITGFGSIFNLSRIFLGWPGSVYFKAHGAAPVCRYPFYKLLLGKKI
jgi:hypothetical protein